MGSIAVTNKIFVYEHNGKETGGHKKAPKVLITSHAFDQVVIHIGDENVTVSGSDLRCAIENALNDN